MAEFTMPSLGADMDEGTLQEWLVQPGDPVHKGDPVAVVETAKSAIGVECFETARMGELLIEPGTTVPVGTPLALIKPTAESAGKPEKAKAKPSVRPALAPVSAPTTAQDRGHIEAGPLVRHPAEQTGVDLEAVQGSGLGGRVTRTDVEQAAAATTAAGQAGVRATPFARRLAAELGVDLATVTGTGRDSAIRAVDVRKAASGPAAPPRGTSPSRCVLLTLRRTGRQPCARRSPT